MSEDYFCRTFAMAEVVSQTWSRQTLFDATEEAKNPFVIWRVFLKDKKGRMTGAVLSVLLSRDTVWPAQTLTESKLVCLPYRGLISHNAEVTSESKGLITWSDQMHF